MSASPGGWKLEDFGFCLEGSWERKEFGLPRDSERRERALQQGQGRPGGHFLDREDFRAKTPAASESSDVPFLEGRP